MKKRNVYDGKIINVRVYEGRPDGPESKKIRREIVEHPGAAAVLAFDENGRVILVKQDRFPHGPTLEIPAGTLEQNESPRACAARELEEETGYTAGRMSHLVSFYPSIGYSTEIIHCYVATKIKPAPGGQNTDDDEYITIQKNKMGQAPVDGQDRKNTGLKDHMLSSGICGQTESISQVLL